MLRGVGQVGVSTAGRDMRGQGAYVGAEFSCKHVDEIKLIREGGLVHGLPIS